MGSQIRSDSLLCVLMRIEVKLAAEKAEAAEQAQAAADPEDLPIQSPQPHQASEQPEDALRQQATGPEQAGQGQKSLHASQPVGVSVQKPAKDAGSRSTRARFADDAGVSDAAVEERTASGSCDTRLQCTGALRSCKHKQLRAACCLLSITYNYLHVSQASLSNPMRTSPWVTIADFSHYYTMHAWGSIIHCKQLTSQPASVCAL